MTTGILHLEGDDRDNTLTNSLSQWDFQIQTVQILAEQYRSLEVPKYYTHIANNAYCKCLCERIYPVSACE